MAQQLELPDWKKALAAKQEVFRATFGPSNPQGQECLRILEKTFQSGTMISDSPAQMGYNIGQHELVSYIKEILESNYAA